VELVAEGADDTDETVDVEMMELERALEADVDADADADADALDDTLLAMLTEGTAELGTEDGSEAEVALAETISVFPSD
jgi:hypothetical protein